MTNFENIKLMIKNNGFNATMAMLAEAKTEIDKEEEGYKKMVSMKEYGGAGYGKIKFPDWVENAFSEVVEKTGVGIFERKGNSGGGMSMSITHTSFAKYIILTTGNGKMLEDIIEVLTSSPAWCMGYGLTRKRMEMVFHILVLHKGNLDETKEELKKLLRHYDPVALKVFANEDDEFRHILNYEAKMISYAEKKVCEKTHKVTKFKIA